jgi:hypothetical protein
MQSQTHETTPTRFAVRPFRINVPEEALVDLRRRVAAIRWRDRETVKQCQVICQLMDGDFPQALPLYWYVSGVSPSGSIPVWGEMERGLANPSHPSILPSMIADLPAGHEDFVPAQGIFPPAMQQVE